MRARTEWRLVCGCVFLLGTLSPGLPVRLFALVATLAAAAVAVCAVRPGSRLRRRLLTAAAAGMLGMLLGWLVRAGGLVASAAGLLVVLLLCSWAIRYAKVRKQPRAIPKPREYVPVLPRYDLIRARRIGSPPSRPRYPDDRGKRAS
ncbi:hypothetical protein [Amycolatopsis sp. WGS_07]|uniref:hypothetical protein n=1 Tax=Amycolatopsis sp. WGS_07 TaxID=3076764 RepID=UPI003873747A